MDVPVPWGQSWGLSGWQGHRPHPRGGMSPTFPHAGQGQGELAHEVVAGGAVMILHHEAQQRQLGCPHLETQRLLPAWVEPCGTGTGVDAALGTPGTPGAPGVPCAASAPVELPSCAGEWGLGRIWGVRHVLELGRVILGK